MQKKSIVMLSIAAVTLLVGTAATATYITQKRMEPEKVAVKTPVKRQQHAEELPWKNQNPAQAHPAPQQTAQAEPACDDRNIVGILAGGAAGGLVGNQIGKGSGNTAAMIGGALGGAYLGSQYIPTRNVTCQ